MDPYDHDLERGLRNRRAILGDAWVDQSTARANAFTADFQNFITRYAWHEVWGRPGLSARTRRILVLAITCALGRWEEFELHLRAGLQGGSGASLGAGDDASTALEPDEVKEVLMQAAIYAGVPAANTGMAIANRLLRELGREPPPRAASEASHPGIGRAHRSAGTPALHYTVREPRHRAPDGAARPTLVLSHPLGCDLSLWDALANTLAAEHRVVAFDHRGHGGSDAPPGPYTLAEMADDAERLLDELEGEGGRSVVWVGLSLGGMVGQELALRHPQRLRALVLAHTSGGFGAEGQAQWRERIAAIEQGGLEAVVDATLQRWFGPATHAEHPALVARWRRRVLSTPLAGYLGACQAVMHVDTLGRLPQLRLPTLVIAGSADASTPPAMAQAIAQAVPDAQLVVLEGAAHLGALEQPAAFESALRGFLARLH